MNKYNPSFQENRNAKKDTLIIRLLAVVFFDWRVSGCNTIFCAPVQLSGSARVTF
ncbi:MAG: hypothetical protein H6936_03160 [Burkholderiales bacterium]|nr:hypothetical protein [Burkholderiales bacterium]